jgi:lysyl-tRNA synthetase class 2
MANPEVRKVFVARSAMIAAIRRFLDERGYVEVETPMMQPLAGGALARPFVTHHNALDMDLYLRIAPELYLKRLVVGGLERVYEINRNFRNEGVSSMHNPEFTMLEFYTAYFDCRDVMDTTEALVAAAARRVRGDAPVVFKGREVPFRVPLARVRMVDAVARALEAEAGLGFTPDVLEEPARLGELVAGAGFREACARRGREAEAYRALSHGKRIAQLFGDFVEESLWAPTFVIDYPVEISPLAKAHPEDPRVADRFELYVAGMEVANGFSELNDPLEQRERFLEQLRQRERGDAEAHVMDEDYVRALGHGLPPTGGCGLGIDRLAMILTDSPSIRDVILFPQMRPEGGRGA